MSAQEVVRVVVRIVRIVVRRDAVECAVVRLQRVVPAATQKALVAGLYLIGDDNGCAISCDYPHIDAHRQLLVAQRVHVLRVASNGQLERRAVTRHEALDGDARRGKHARGGAAGWIPRVDTCATLDKPGTTAPAGL